MSRTHACNVRAEHSRVRLIPYGIAYAVCARAVYIYLMDVAHMCVHAPVSILTLTYLQVSLSVRRMPLELRSLPRQHRTAPAAHLTRRAGEGRDKGKRKGRGEEAILRVCG